MAAQSPEVRKFGEMALDKLDRLPMDDNNQSKQQIDEAIRLLVTMRDRLIESRRAGQPKADEWLSQTNGILSSLFGTEFPKGGLQWKRVCESRDSLRALLT